MDPDGYSSDIGAGLLEEAEANPGAFEEPPPPETRAQTLARWAAQDPAQDPELAAYAEAARAAEVEAEAEAEADCEPEPEPATD